MGRSSRPRRRRASVFSDGPTLRADHIAETRREANVIMNPETRADASAFEEVTALYERYRRGAITRDDLLDRLAAHLGGAAAASILPILESRRAQTAEQAWAMTIAELSDRQEIQRNVWDFSNAIDLQAWDMLDEVLTPDAEIGYGGVALVGPE